MVPECNLKHQIKLFLIILFQTPIEDETLNLNKNCSKTFIPIKLPLNIMEQMQ